MTGIEWTDRTWNPVRGCSRVSEGCRNCYAERQAARFSDEGSPWHRFAERFSPRDGLEGALAPWVPRWTGRVELVPEKLSEPLRWRKPSRVFVNSMSDLFHEALPDEAIDAVFAVMAEASHHTFQVLTKRPERMRAYMAAGDALWGERWPQAAQRILGECEPYPFPLPNVHLGVSVEDQVAADERIPLLLQTPAALRFVSAEPLLGAVDLAPWVRCPRCKGEGLHDVVRQDQYGPPAFHRQVCWCRFPGKRPAGRGLDWVIVGGESGPGARPCDVGWIRSIVQQCKAAGVAAFVKQLGAQAGITVPVQLGPREEPVFYPRDGGFWPGDTDGWIPAMRHPKGGDPSEWPEDLRVRELPR